MPPWGSLLNRFYGIQDFPYLKLGFRDLNLKLSEIRDRKCTREVVFKYNHRDYGIAGKFGSKWQDWRSSEGTLHRDFDIKIRRLFINNTKLEDLYQILCTVFIFSKGTISVRAPCALYLVVAVVLRETVRFEKEGDFKKEIWLKVFSCFLKNDNPESFILHFFSRKVYTVFFINGGSTLSRSPQNDKTSNIW